MNDADKKLEAIRREIDGLDNDLLALISRRAGLAKKVAEVKDGQVEDEEGRAHYYRPEREAEVLRSLVDGNDGPLPDRHVARIFQEIMSACRALQKPLAVAYLGPEGTFTERAALKHFGHAIDPQPVDSIGAVFRQVESGGGDYGVVPIENSTEGVVGHTLDLFVSSGLSICGEVELRIHHCLMAAGGGSRTSGKFIPTNSPSRNAGAGWTLICRRRCAKLSAVMPRPRVARPARPARPRSPGRPPLTTTDFGYWPATSRTNRATPRDSS